MQTFLIFVLLMSGPGDDATQIRALIETSEDINNRGDVDAWVAMFAEDAVYMPPNSLEVKTRDGLRKMAQAGFSAWKSSIAIEPKEIVVSGDLAFARTHVTGEVVSRAGGDPIAIDLKQIVIYRRSPSGIWKVSRMIGNSNLQ